MLHAGDFNDMNPGAGRRGPIDLVAEGIRSRAIAAAEERPAPKIVVVAAGHDDAPVSYPRLAAAIAVGIAVGTLIATATIDFAVSRCAWPGVYCEAAFDPSRLDTEPQEQIVLDRLAKTLRVDLAKLAA